MVTKGELKDFADKDPEYLVMKVKAILKAVGEEDMDFPYIREKIESIQSFMREASFDIEKCRAENEAEMAFVFMTYRGYTADEANRRVKGLTLRTCTHCKRNFFIHLRKDCKNLCPHCYKEIEVGK